MTTNTTKCGLKSLSALQLLEFAKQLCNSYPSAIKQNETEEDYLTVYGKTYVVIKKEDIREKMIEWIEGIGPFEYILSIDGFPVSFSDILNALGHKMIVDKPLFVKNSRDYILNEYDEKNSEYSSLEDFVKSDFGLEMEDLPKIEKLWSAEVLALPSFIDQSEFLINAAPYEVDTDAINQEIVKNLEDYDVLGDYGKEGKYDLGDIVIFKKDL